MKTLVRAVRTGGFLRRVSARQDSFAVDMPHGHLNRTPTRPEVDKTLQLSAVASAP